MVETLDGVGTVSDCFHDFVVWRDHRVGDMFVLKVHCVAEAVALCTLDVAPVCAIMLR